MNPSKVLAVWMHLGPAQLIVVFVPPETDCQLDFYASWQVSYQVKRQLKSGQVRWMRQPATPMCCMRCNALVGNADDDTAILTGGSEDEGSAAAAASPD
jgi:hypothetical protein